MTRHHDGRVSGLAELGVLGATNILPAFLQKPSRDLGGVGFVFHEPRPWIALISAIVVGIIFARTYYWSEGKTLAYGRRLGWWGRE